MNRYKDSLFPLLKQGFSEKALEDLATSGLTFETVQRMGLLPLTKENFQKYLHFSLVERSTRERIVEDGYIIPYIHVTPDFGRLKVLKWNERSAYYQQKKENLPKYMQPSKQHLENPTPLYYLPDVQKRLKSPKTVYVVTEGEKKTAKLQQELEKLETEYRKFAVIGVGGVWNWGKGSAWEKLEQRSLSLKDRTVYICFDADAFVKDELGTCGNVNVAKAEISLYAFLLSKGVKTVKSFVWDANEGKGIDDLLVRKEEKGESPVEVLKELFQNAVSPIEKYKDVLSFESILKGLAEFLPELPGEVVEEIVKSFKVKKRELRKRFKEVAQRRREELEERLKEEEKVRLLRTYKELFGIEFVPKLPEKTEKRGEKLYYKGELVSPFFVVRKIYINADEVDKGFSFALRFIDGKEVRVSNKVLSSYKLLAEYLNREGIPTSELEARRIADYITKFLKENYEQIPKGYYSTRVGWGKIEGEEVYIHPATCNIELLLTGDVEGKLQRTGERKKELEAVKKLFEISPYAGLVYCIGVSATLLAPLLKEDYNLVVLVQGESGSGKTTAIKGAVSFFASPSLKRRFSFTENGFEVFISKFKDFPLHLEEIRDLDASPQKRAEKFVKFLYEFVEGSGKTRLFADLSLRPVAEMRGLIFTSSEVGIEEVLSYLGDSYREGIKRRLLVIPSSEELFGGSKLAKVVETFRQHHGNLLPEWIEHFLKNKRRIEEAFKEREADFLEGYSRLDAKLVRFLAVVSVVIIGKVIWYRYEQSEGCVGKGRIVQWKNLFCYGKLDGTR